MKQCLLHAATFARIGTRLKAFDAHIQPIIMDNDGKIEMPWGNIQGDAAEKPRPDIAFGNTDVWFGGGAHHFLGANIQSPEFDWFQSSAAGIEHPALRAIGQKARLYTTNHTQAEAMAEWALWSAFDFFRNGPQRRADMQAKNYQKRNSREINGSHWLIIGFGAIGAAVGRRVRALGGHVTGLRRSGGTSPDADAIVGPEQMLVELGKAEVVLLCAPHTAQAEGMVDAIFLAAMQYDGLLMNLGRGALVD
jgi:phosphoglycerate dehydrogenase-like enzyme